MKKKKSSSETNHELLFEFEVQHTIDTKPVIAVSIELLFNECEADIFCQCYSWISLYYLSKTEIFSGVLSLIVIPSMVNPVLSKMRLKLEKNHLQTVD